MVGISSGGSGGIISWCPNFLDWVDWWWCNGHGCCNRMRISDGFIKGGFEEGFNFGSYVWGDRGNNTWGKVEYFAQANGFKAWY